MAESTGLQDYVAQDPEEAALDLMVRQERLERALRATTDSLAQRGWDFPAFREARPAAERALAAALGLRERLILETRPGAGDERLRWT
jgi:hypothetical protein